MDGIPCLAPEALAEDSPLRRLFVVASVAHAGPRQRLRERLFAQALIASERRIRARSVADIDDDPASPDGTWAIWDGNGDSDLIVNFPTPTGNPTTGAGLQAFRVRIRRDGGTGTNSVAWAMDLYENGLLVTANLTTGTTTSNAAGGTRTSKSRASAMRWKT